MYSGVNYLIYNLHWAEEEEEDEKMALMIKEICITRRSGLTFD